MKLHELHYAPELTLPVPTLLHRIQRTRARRGSVAVGPLRLAPRGLLNGRFDLPDAEVAYFAETPATAVYETLARRETPVLAFAALQQRVLLVLRTTRPIILLDLRPHAAHWPVLQSLRYDVTRAIALEARTVGYEGVVYRSAQQYNADCYALFESGLRGMRLLSKEPLVAGNGALHRAAADAIRGAKIPVV